MPNVRLALAQTNPTVGDIQGNLVGIWNVIEQAVTDKADILVFGEMAITGYPIEDLASRESFILEAELAVRDLANKLTASQFKDLAVVIGHPAISALGKV